MKLQLPLVSVLLVLHHVSSYADASEPHVEQVSFCLSRGLIEPTCEGPLIPKNGNFEIDLNELTKDEEGNRIIWVWSSVRTPANIKVAYVLSQEHTGTEWSEAVHVHWIDRSISVLETLVQEAKELLATIHQREYKFTQGAFFAVERNSRNRWPARFTIGEPGTFHLSIVELGSKRKVVPGGEPIRLHVNN